MYLMFLVHSREVAIKCAAGGIPTIRPQSASLILSNLVLSNLPAMHEQHSMRSEPAHI